MRRLLAFVASVLVVLGLELSTQILTLTISRITAGVRAIMAGAEFYVPTGRFVVGLVFVIAGLVLFGLLVWSGGVHPRVGAVGAVCPNCGGRTQRVRRRRWQRLFSLLVGRAIARRRCETCGWVGLALRD